MAKANKPNPLKHFNDEKAKRLVKAQKGMTAFQSYIKNVPGASPSDTLGVNDPRTFDFGYPSRDAKANAQAAAFQATYGNKSGRGFEGSSDEKAARIPQNKGSVKAYTKSIPTAPPSNKYRDLEMQKKGGQKKYDKGGPKDSNAKDDYSKKIAAGKKAGYVVDQPGAYKKNLTDTAQVTYMRGPSGDYAGVKKPAVKKTGGQTKSKKK
jgi:hypothetical protein